MMVYADRLITLGYVVLNPLLSHFHQLVMPRSWDDWIRQSLGMVGVSDVVFRISRKESRGADIEESYALGNGIPVVESIDELLEEFPCGAGVNVSVD
jgi:hypothetical protein